MNLRSVLRILAVLVVLAAAVWFTLRSVDFSSLAANLGTIRWSIVLAMVPVILASHYVRAVRWMTILSPSHNADAERSAQRRHTWSGFSAVLVGYASSVIVPRSGELLRPWIFTRSTGIPLGTTISSVVVERLLDVLTLLAGLGAIVVFQRERLMAAVPALSAGSLIVSVVIPAFILIVAIILIAFTRLGVRFATFVRKRIHLRFGTWLDGAMLQVRKGTEAVRTPGLWLRLFIETMAMWFLYIAPLWLLFRAMPLNVFVPLGFGDAAFMLVVLSVGVTIAPTPGALGVYQGFAQTALVQVYAATPSEGLAFGIAAWVVNYGVALISGAICLALEFRSGLTLKSFKSVRSDVHASSSK